MVHKYTFTYLIALSSLLLGCSQGALSLNWKDSSSTSENSESSPSLNNAYETQALSILQNNCFSCHTQSSGPANVFDLGDVNHLVSTGLIVPGEPSQSTLYIAVSTSAMPPTGPLSASDQQVLANWIAGSSSGGGTAPTPTPTPSSGSGGSNTNATFTYIQNNTISVHCLGCHSNFSDYNTLMGEVVASNPDSSPLFNMVNSGQMPQGGPFLTADEIGDIYDWILSGAPNN